jgi:predicted ATP-grasp superfamily ATP-dependent carboligase
VTLDTSRPVLLLGGGASTLAAARSLGSAGIPVIASGPVGCRAMVSRYCAGARPVPHGVNPQAFWRRLLIDRPEEALAGTLILAGCDESLEFVEANHRVLRQRHLIEEFVPELRRAMLDKLQTLELAREAGVPTPNFWRIDTCADLRAILREIMLPVMVKPLNSHAFMKEFGRKLFIVRDSVEDVADKVALCHSRGHRVMVVEMIPGPDRLLSSYYTYRTPQGRLLYDYTKSVIRRWPVNRGGACFHQSEWLPETAEMGRRLFEGIGWQGIGNAEFKLDPRDDKLKIIEVNGRLTAGHPLLTRGGAPIDLMIYCYLTGQQVPPLEAYAQDLRMWDPLRDFMAYRQLARRGELSLLSWIRSVLGQKLILPFFSLDDPRPGLAEAWGTIAKALARPVRPDQEPQPSAD